MQVNLDCRKPCPQFGKFKIDGTKEAAEIGEECLAAVYKEANNVLFNYIGADSPIVRRGFKQYKQELAKLKIYDVVYDWSNNVCRVVNNQTEKVVHTFGDAGKNTGIEHFGITRFPGRKLFARLFNPKRFLPYNFILAGEKAKALESKALAEQKAVNDFLRT